METIFGETPSKYDKKEIDRVNVEYSKNLTKSNSSGCSVQPKVRHQKERATLWYLYDNKRGHFVYHHLDEGWDEVEKPKCHIDNQRWSKELAWKDKSEIATFKVSYSDV